MYELDSQLNVFGFDPYIPLPPCNSTNNSGFSVNVYVPSSFFFNLEFVFWISTLFPFKSLSSGILNLLLSGLKTTRFWTILKLYNDLNDFTTSKLVTPFWIILNTSNFVNVSSDEISFIAFTFKYNSFKLINFEIGFTSLIKFLFNDNDLRFIALSNPSTLPIPKLSKFADVIFSISYS